MACYLLLAIEVKVCRIINITGEALLGTHLQLLQMRSEADRNKIIMFLLLK